MTQPQKPWLKRNWIWLTTVSIVVLLTIFIYSPIGNAVTDIARVSNESKIYEDAFTLASENKEVLEKLGVLETITQLDIIEGHVQYTDNNEAINMSVRVIGDKSKGKLDIEAIRRGLDWDYKLIKIRIKNPKQEIVVLED